MDKKTSTILLRVSLEQKELWVGQAHDERVSLSEWIRRRCNGGLGADGHGVALQSLKGGQPEGGDSGKARTTGPTAPAGSAMPSAPSPQVRPDPKTR